MTSIHDFQAVTDALGVYPDELGIVMLDYEPIENPGMPVEWEYYSPKQEEWWMKGYVGDKAHISLRYGLLKPAEELRKEITILLEGLSFPKAHTLGVKSFAQPTNPHAAIVLEILIEPELLELHRRLSYLPHVDTFTPWVPHVTLAYVHAAYADEAVSWFASKMSHTVLVPKGLNLGEDKY